MRVVFAFITGGMALLIGLVLFRRPIVRRFNREDPTTRCMCGYVLDRLDTIRCPECGRVRGFDATAEELELTPEQLRLAKTRRDARERPVPPPLPIE